MAGFPFSGKSYILTQVLAKLPEQLECLIIDPKQYCYDNYETLPEEEQREMRLAAWQASNKMVQEHLEKMADIEMLVYDTSCASYLDMQPLFVCAKKHGHHIIYLYIQTDLEVCAKRAKDHWLSESAIEKYRQNFLISIPKLIKMANQAYIIKNNSQQIPDVSRIIEGVINHYDRIRQLNGACDSAHRPQS